MCLCKDTNLKANHNSFDKFISFRNDCFRYFKDTKLKANHNFSWMNNSPAKTVSDILKILNWKQITTETWIRCSRCYCFRYFKDTKLKANHNLRWHVGTRSITVSDISKILNWKQITTETGHSLLATPLFPIFQRY